MSAKTKILDRGRNFTAVRFPTGKTASAEKEMKYLLDTMAWLWSVGPTEKIGSAGLEVLTNGEAELHLSAASAWEVAIEARLGKFTLAESPVYVPQRLSSQGIRSRAITQNHPLKVYDLPAHHRDPFDRLLIAQPMLEKMTILTADRAFAKYPVDVFWCGKVKISFSQSC
jgi:PIN domain nuclease of toxin-antitoxin system